MAIYIQTINEIIPISINNKDSLKFLDCHEFLSFINSILMGLNVTSIITLIYKFFCLGVIKY
jgi:hypothetical protein